MHDASRLPGCNPSCDQIGSQLAVKLRIKAIAARDGRRAPNLMLYVNAVYLWPFDSTWAKGEQVQLMSTNGKPHLESCDPGIYPSSFWDFGRASGREAWLQVVDRAFVNGPADGLYVDCYKEMPVECLPNGTCIARRNGRLRSENEVITRAQVQAYIQGKNDTMTRASGVVVPNGTFFSKGAKASKPPPYGGNLNWVSFTTNANIGKKHRYNPANLSMAIGAARA